MSAFATAADRFWRDETGTDLVQYVIMVAFVAIGTAAVATVSGSSAMNVWSGVSSAIAGTPAVPPGSSSASTSTTSSAGGHDGGGHGDGHGDGR